MISLTQNGNLPAELLDSIEVGIVVLDRDFNVEEWNKFMENHSSIPPHDIKGTSLFNHFSEIDEKWLRLKSGPVFNLKSPVFIIWEQRQYLFKFGGNRPITCQASYMYQNVTMFPLISETGEVERFCIVVYDVTDQALSKIGMERLNEELKTASRIDGLTGLFNRRYWQERFEQSYKLAKRQDKASTAMMLDIDHFKKINDNYGHPAGDEVIRQLAQLIEDVSRETDICGRYGGEEFAILLPDTASANVMVLAQRIRASVEKLKIEYEQHTISFTVSLGIAQFNTAFGQHIQWLEEADKALYQAKKNGRNQVIIAGS